MFYISFYPIEFVFWEYVSADVIEFRDYWIVSNVKCIIVKVIYREFADD